MLPGFTEVAPSKGTFTIQFAAVNDNAQVSGMEILSGQPAPRRTTSANHDTRLKAQVMKLSQREPPELMATVRRIIARFRRYRNS